MKIVFATNNPNKLKEVKLLLPTIEILSLQDIGCFEDIPETAETLEGNAILKANYVTKKYGFNCFADDTGLEVASLNGAPGVYSARYAGENCSFEDNVQKVLKELDGIKNRKAKFRTVIALILNGKEYFFEGSVDGEMLTENQGDGGFGYDPISNATVEPGCNSLCGRPSAG